MSHTRGKNDDEVSKELVDFLHYLEDTTDERAEMSDSERIKKIHERVRKVKLSEEIGVKYMQAWEEKYYERQEGKAEGKAETILILLSEMGDVEDVVKEIIMSQTDLDTLDIWVKKAARASSIRQFIEETGITV